ncbi:MAG: hypothetical protein Kow0099_09650 [Candidatus Abyssubacteria bacterium]
MNASKKTASLIEAGFARVDITPTQSLPMGGYLARQSDSAGVHDLLYVKAAALRDGEKSVLLLSFDILCLSHEWTQRLKNAISQETGIPARNILAAATHTHSGPQCFVPVIARTEPVIRYEEQLLARGLEAARKACDTLEPAALRVSRVATTRISRDRRDPAQFPDIAVSVVRIETPSGKVRGHLVSFPCHPTVMPPSNLQYSADLFGEAARQVECSYRDSICLMFNGAAANLSTRFSRKSQTWEELERFGKLLARRIVHASKKSVPICTRPLLTSLSTMRVPFRDILPVEQAREQYEKAASDWNDPGRMLERSISERLLERAAFEAAAGQLIISQLGSWSAIFGADTAELHLQIIRVGDLIICGLPGEFFDKRGADLAQAASPKFGFVIGYANGYWGYFVPSMHMSAGGYEAVMSPINASTEARTMRRMVTLVRNIKKSTASKRVPARHA